MNKSYSSFTNNTTTEKQMKVKYSQIEDFKSLWKNQYKWIYNVYYN